MKTLKIDINANSKHKTLSFEFQQEFFYSLKMQRFEFSNSEITHLCSQHMRKTTLTMSLHCFKNLEATSHSHMR
jgi:hypothetical protein